MALWLHNRTTELLLRRSPRTALRIFFTAAVVVLFVAVVAVRFSPHSARQRSPSPPAPTISFMLVPPQSHGAASRTPESAGEEEGESAGGETDLYGNDVMDAVARYQLDPAGTLYEQHSPRTELPRLGSPKS